METFFVLNFQDKKIFLKMGCLCTRDGQKETSTNEEEVKKPKYSWDERRKSNFNPQDYIIENLDNKESIKSPGSIDGQQFIIQNCKDSTIYILDYSNTITVDDCTNCKIVLGPIKGSLFLRNCVSCICVAACSQFRTRDCRKLHVFLYSSTQPIIEASSGIHFGSYQLHYSNITDHLRKTGLNLALKNWDLVHDFTPVESETNWSFTDANVKDYIKEPTSNEICSELSKCEHSWAYLEQNTENNVPEPNVMMETTI